jgi:hypothetical protein
VRNSTRLIVAAAVGVLLFACGLSTLGTSGQDVPSSDASADGGGDGNALSDVFSAVDGALDAGVTPGEAGADGCVANVTSDPKNCGACGHDCLGGSCESGACLPFRFGFIDASAESIATNDAGVYWVVQNGSAVLECPLAGCTSPGSVLAGSLSNTVALAAVGPTLAVLDSNDLQAVTTPAGAATMVYPPSSFTINSGYTVCTDGAGHLAVASSSNGQRTVDRIFIDGGGLGNLAYTNNLSAVGCGAGHLFWQRNDVGYDTIYACADPADCGAPASIYPGPNTTETHITATVDQVYFTRRSQGTLNRCALAGCVQPTILYTGVDLNGVALDGQFVYFTSGTGGIVARCTQDGCGASYTALATNQINPHALIVTDTAIYWATDGIPPAGADAGTMPAIYRLAKSP